MKNVVGISKFITIALLVCLCIVLSHANNIKNDARKRRRLSDIFPSFNLPTYFDWSFGSPFYGAPMPPQYSNPYNMKEDMYPYNNKLDSDSCYIYDHDYKGNEFMWHKNIANPAMCQHLCEVHDLCLYFGYDPITKDCYLKDEKDPSREQFIEDYIYGPKRCYASNELSHWDMFFNNFKQMFDDFFAYGSGYPTNTYQEFYGTRPSVVEHAPSSHLDRKEDTISDNVRNSAGRSSAAAEIIKPTEYEIDEDDLDDFIDINGRHDTVEFVHVEDEDTATMTIVPLHEVSNERIDLLQGPPARVHMVDKKTDSVDTAHAKDFTNDVTYTDIAKEDTPPKAAIERQALSTDESENNQVYYRDDEPFASMNSFGSMFNTANMKCKKMCSPDGSQCQQTCTQV